MSTDNDDPNADPNTDGQQNNFWNPNSPEAGKAVGEVIGTIGNVIFNPGAPDGGNPGQTGGDNPVSTDLVLDPPNG